MALSKSKIIGLGVVGTIMVMMACSDQKRSGPSSLSAIGEQLPSAIGAWKVDSPFVSYTPETLFEYINGHAEVYLAYGLRGSIAQRYLGKDDLADIIVDVFELATPVDAYGVFTHDQDGEEVDIGQGALFRYGWLSFWKGPYFVSIYAEGESDQAVQAVLEIGRLIAATIPVEGSLPIIMKLLPARGLQERTKRYLHHPNILAAHLSLSSENLLKLGPAAVAALGRYEREGESAHLLVVRYEDSGSANQASVAFAETFLADGQIPRMQSDGWYAMSRLPGDTEIVAFVVRAGTTEMAETLLSETEALANGGSG